MANIEVIAAIVTFQPELDHLERSLSMLSPQVSSVVIVDNGSQNQAALLSRFGDTAGLKVLANLTNDGIAAALNHAMSEASADSECLWVLTLDQDSLVPPGYVTQLLGSAHAEVGIVAPQIVDRAETKEPPEQWTPHLNGSSPVPQAITSGSLTRVDAWRAVGGFDEEMFIDLVDFEFCARLRRAGWLILSAEGVSLWHQLGSLEIRRVLGREVRVTHHSPWRTKQYARNTVYVARKLERRWWPPRLWRSLAHRALKVLLFEGGRVEGAYAILGGCWYGATATVRR